MEFTAQLRTANQNGSLILTVPKREAELHGFEDGETVTVQMTAINESN